jgi:hypothetical protein
MKNTILATLILVALSAGTSCKKDNSHPGGSTSGLPSTPAPQGLANNWANGYASMTELINVYTGKVVGNAWVSGRFFKITSNGKNAEFYYSVETQYMQAATKATGNIAFDEGSTATEGVFTFYADWGHYNGWGTTSVNRDATKDELKNNLTRRYYYRMDGEWLRIEPDGPVNDYSSSFEQIN